MSNGDPKTEQSDASGVPYQSLYRRFRPQRFADVLGQDHVTHTLRNAVATGRVAHAYLFSGPRGTGKTSTARILAKALNCTESTDGEPCDHCDSCLSIAAGTSFDVHELDAASNNGVDAMRDLVARASLASPGRWKVYIVDEVHMLSTAASNALLKTLEEPPDHVVFVLATTDPQKVLLTIRSRTQHFEFHLLNEDVLETLLHDVARRASLALPDGALDVARRRAKGSARDALSVLDQVATAGVVEDDSDSLARIIAAIAQSDTAQAIDALDEALHNGRDPHQVAIELVERMRTGFLRLVAPNARNHAVDTVAQSEATEVAALGAARCVRAMELVGRAIVAMRDAPDPRITLEVALIRLTHPEAEDSPDALVDRIERLERRIESLSAPTATTIAPSPPIAPAQKQPIQPDPPASPPRELEQRDSPTPPNARADRSTPKPTTPSAPTQSSARPALGAFQNLEGKPNGGAPSSPITNDAVISQPVGRHGDSTDAPGVGVSIPNRDAIVTAWGDHLLVGLRPKVRAIYQIGRFTGVEGSHAVLALPNEAHIAHAEPLRGEVETVLSGHFGCAIGLKLVTDTPGRSAPPEIEDDSPSETRAAGVDAQTSAESVDEAATQYAADDGIEDPKLGVAWAEDRLLQAFPGAEEVETS